MRRIMVGKEENIYVDEANEFLKLAGHVGYESMNKRTFLVKMGPAKGSFVYASDTWQTLDNLDISCGKFYLFDTKKELYQWLLDGVG